MICTYTIIDKYLQSKNLKYYRLTVDEFNSVIYITVPYLRYLFKLKLVIKELQLRQFFWVKIKVKRDKEHILFLKNILFFL
jgi:hypothetical protein